MGGTQRSLAGQHSSAGLQRVLLILIVQCRCSYWLGLQVTCGFRTRLWEKGGAGPGRAEDPVQAEGTQWLTLAVRPS